MWVLKIGGSLAQDAALPAWLDLVARLGGGRIALVPGGGAFADGVRQAQARWGFDDLPAHNMAVLAMAQMAYMLQGMAPGLQLAASEAEIRLVLRRGRAALWMPLACLRQHTDESTHWGVTSDSLALGLAQRLNAERLVIVKSCAIDRSLDLQRQGEAGVLDASFATLAAAAFPIELIGKDELARLRALLLGELPVSA